jgi:hypothetical protein
MLAECMCAAWYGHAGEDPRADFGPDYARSNANAPGFIQAPSAERAPAVVGVWFSVALASGAR